MALIHARQYTEQYTEQYKRQYKTHAPTFGETFGETFCETFCETFQKTEVGWLKLDLKTPRNTPRNVKRKMQNKKQCVSCIEPKKHSPNHCFLFSKKFCQTFCRAFWKTLLYPITGQLVKIIISPSRQTSYRLKIEIPSLTFSKTNRYVPLASKIKTLHS